MIVKKPKYLWWILGTEAVGILSGLLSRDAVAIYSDQVVKPALSPPALLFPVVWGILYDLMGIGAARIAASGESIQRYRGLNLYVIQLVLNFFWSLIFFNLQRYGLAFLWLLLLWIVVFAMIVEFRKTDPLAAWLQIPYLLWLSFAAYLNFAVWQLNR